MPAAEDLHSPPEFSEADSKAIRALIPAATAMQPADLLSFEEVRRSTSTPPPSALEYACKNKSLTLILFTLQPGEDEATRTEFEYLKPLFETNQVMGQEMARGAQLVDADRKKGPITLLHADRITDFTCTADGKHAARGAISFEVPDGYRGQVQFSARRADQKWQIHQFQLPAYGINLILDENGVWRKENSAKRNR
jgi:hypothetical protein